MTMNKADDDDIGDPDDYDISAPMTMISGTLMTMMSTMISVTPDEETLASLSPDVNP